MSRHDRGTAPDYTNAFLVSALPLVMIVLTAIWVVWGFLTALGVSYATDRVIVARRHPQE